MDDNKKNYITSDELKKHNKPDDLWLSIQGKVYNVTDWAKIHPGGDIPLLNLAGQDVTDAFIAFHPGTAWKHLDKYFTGYHLEDFQVSEVSRDYRNLATQFAKSGLFEKKGHGVIYSLCFVFLLFSACIYGVLCSDSFCIHMLSGCLLGFAWIQHRVVEMDDNAHHAACNSLDFDPDLQHLPVFAVSSNLFQSLTSQFYKRQLTFDSLARFFVSYQHFTFYPVMVVARVNLYLQTFLLLFSNRKVPDRALNILGILVFWTWFPLLLSCLPNWNERVLFILASFCVTSIQHIQFCLNHFAANVYELCKKHNLPYRSLSFFEANKWTLNTLRSAALEARDFSRPFEEFDLGSFQYSWMKN
ncbi:hypothetical protein DH2020_023103 [Rehmannia glutinosa]|uniref:Cytochrome b5 heme-binding domain-containing protein n=1 Tax=Rehmannia glutinosa TaxID=99300 RepID=A0ABR0W9F7_REHGL